MVQCKVFVQIIFTRKTGSHLTLVVNLFCDDQIYLTVLLLRGRL